MTCHKTFQWPETIIVPTVQPTPLTECLLANCHHIYLYFNTLYSFYNINYSVKISLKMMSERAINYWQILLTFNQYAHTHQLDFYIFQYVKMIFWVVNIRGLLNIFNMWKIISSMLKLNSTSNTWLSNTIVLIPPVLD